MPERPINYTVSLSSTNVTSADLVSNNGNIETSGGADVVIGVIESDNEAEFGDPDRGVTSVKGALPNGDLRVNSNGDIYVNGHGAVTLEGPYREVSSVSGHNGQDGDLKVDGSGNLYSEYTTTSTDTATNENTGTHSGTLAEEASDVEFNTVVGSPTSISTTYPSPSQSYELVSDHHVVVDINHDTNASGPATYEVDYILYPSGPTYTETTPSLDPGTGHEVTRFIDDSNFSDYTGSDAQITDVRVVSGADGPWGLSLDVYTHYLLPGENQEDSINLSYPSVPSGYNFEKHECFYGPWSTSPGEGEPYDGSISLLNGFGDSIFSESGSSSSEISPSTLDSFTQESGERVEVIIEINNVPHPETGYSIDFGARTIGTKQTTTTHTPSVSFS